MQQRIIYTVRFAPIPAHLYSKTKICKCISRYYPHPYIWNSNKTDDNRYKHIKESPGQIGIPVEKHQQHITKPQWHQQHKRYDDPCKQQGGYLAFSAHTAAAIG